MNGAETTAAWTGAAAHAQLFSLHGQVALVTGASSGLGREIAWAYGRAGAQVLVNGRDTLRVRETVARLQNAGYAATELMFDVNDASARDAALAHVVKRWGRLDILVNNAGQRLRAPIEQITPADFDGLLRTNLSAAYALSRAAAQCMQAQGYGRIVMITSIAAQLARAGDVAYISAKGGLESLMRALACEYGPSGVTCNAIAPGAFLTDVNRPAHVAGNSFSQRTPLGRWGEPHEIAGPALFLASPAASYVNGHVLTVDGGYSIAF
jgi:gluconate 5-dehydrogenase